MTAARRIVAWTSLTLDGYTSGPDGTEGDIWLYEHAGQPATSTDPRTRDLGRWLDATEKVVLSRTLTDTPWENSRIARDLATIGVTALEHGAVGLHLRRA